MSKREYLKEKLLEKIDESEKLSIKNIEELSKEEIDDLVNNNVKYCETYFDELPKDIIGEIVNACRPTITCEYKLPDKYDSIINVEFYIEIRFDSHLWSNKYNLRIQFCEFEGITIDDKYLNEIKIFNINWLNFSSSLSIEFFVGDLKKITVVYGKYFNIDVSKFIEQLNSSDHKYEEPKIDLNTSYYGWEKFKNNKWVSFCKKISQEIENGYSKRSEINCFVYHGLIINFRYMRVDYFGGSMGHDIRRVIVNK